MVFEQLFKFRQIKHNSFNLFILGFIFSEMGILSALLVFREEAPIMSLAFTSVLAMPFLFSLMEIKNIEVRSGKSFFHNVFNNNSHIIISYLMLFFFFFFRYAMFSIFLPGFSMQKLFESQLAIISGLAGKAVFGQALTGFGFGEIFFNNLAVLFACFFFSLVLGVGSILFLTWNASVWGTLMGFFAKQSAGVVGQAPIVAFLIMFLKYFPHLITEAAAYFFAIVAGVVISQTLINEHLRSDKFRFTMLEGLCLFGISIFLLVAAAVLEVYVFTLYA